MKIPGFSTRADGKTRANLLSSPATGQDRAAVKIVRRAFGAVTECPTCGGIGSIGKGGHCADDWHRACGR